MGNARFVSFASVISEIQQSDLFMTVKARILETPKANLNGARVTPAFVDDILANEERYVGLPLYADVKALTSGKYNRLGHLYDTRTGEFHSTQIGSFYEFAKEEFEGGSYLIGFARIPKRNKALSKAIAELFADDALKFSFEISCGEYKELDDGTIEIDASEHNYLEGTAIVTFPACEDAVALEFVAQRTNADDTQGGETEMAENKNKVIEEVEQTAEVAEQEIETPAEEKVDEAIAENEANASDEADASEDKEETASVIVREQHHEVHDTSAYDTESGQEIHQTIAVSTETIEHQDGQIVQTTDGIHVAQNDIVTDGDGGDNDPAEPASPAETEIAEEKLAEDEEEEEEPAQTTPDPKQAPESSKKTKKTAEEMIEELAETVKALTAEVESLKQARQEHIAASAVVAEMPNPFIESIDAKGKYSLLESISKKGNSLLESV